MRVLHAVHAYPPSLGGSERVVARLSQGLSERGHTVEVATAEHPDRTGPVDGIPVKGFPDDPRGWLAYRRWVHKGLSQDRWDVVMTYHSKVWTHLALAPFKGSLADRWVYAPTEFTDIDSRHPRHLAYYRTAEPLSIRRAARTMVLTRRDAELAVELAGDAVADRVRIVPNGVDADWWAKGTEGQVRARLGLPLEAPLVLYVGGLWPHKDVETLIEAMGHLEDHHLVCAGPTRGRKGEMLGRAAKASARERVHLLGSVEREDLRALYHACSVHASASTNEGFGLTFLEAMACDKPVVARPVGVIPELVDQGAEVEVAEDAASFAQAIARLSTTPTTNSTVAHRYDWEQVVDQLVELYEEVAR